MPRFIPSYATMRTLSPMEPPVCNVCPSLICLPRMNFAGHHLMVISFQGRCLVFTCPSSAAQFCFATFQSEQLSGSLWNRSLASEASVENILALILPPEERDKRPSVPELHCS